MFTSRSSEYLLVSSVQLRWQQALNAAGSVPTSVSNGNDSSRSQEKVLHTRCSSAEVLNLSDWLQAHRGISFVPAGLG